MGASPCLWFPISLLYHFGVGSRGWLDLVEGHPDADGLEDVVGFVDRQAQGLALAGVDVGADQGEILLEYWGSAVQLVGEADDAVDVGGDAVANFGELVEGNDAAQGFDDVVPAAFGVFVEDGAALGAVDGAVGFEAVQDALDGAEDTVDLPRLGVEF